jgi:hypothetical protein
MTAEPAEPAPTGIRAMGRVEAAAEAAWVRTRRINSFPRCILAVAATEACMAQAVVEQGSALYRGRIQTPTRAEMARRASLSLHTHRSLQRRPVPFPFHQIPLRIHIATPRRLRGHRKTRTHGHTSIMSGISPEAAAHSPLTVPRRPITRAPHRAREAPTASTTRHSR